MMRGRRVTVFGGSGFLGRHLVQRLARAGARILVAVRNPESAMFLKPLGDPGQIVPTRGRLQNEREVAAAVEGADAVVNLVGILYERGRQTFRAVQADGPRRVAEAAADAGVRRLIQISAIGASPGSPSVYARTKAAGEDAAREAFDAATIVRPSIVFGPEDQFFNRFAALAQFLPALPLYGGGHTRFQPVYVGDVADAMMRILEDGATAGATYEFGGPHVYTFREIMELILRETRRRRLLLPLPFWVAELQAMVFELMPVPLLTRDQVTLLKRDNVVSGEAPGLADLGITATAVEAIVPACLARFRRGGAYDARPAV